MKFAADQSPRKNSEKLGETPITCHITPDSYSHHKSSIPCVLESAKRKESLVVQFSSFLLKSAMSPQNAKRRASLKKKRTTDGHFTRDAEDVDTIAEVELTEEEIASATKELEKVMQLAWKDDAKLDSTHRGPYGKDSERTQRHHRQLLKKASEGSRKVHEFFGKEVESKPEESQSTESQPPKKRMKFEEAPKKYGLSEALEALEEICDIGKSKKYSDVSAYEHSRHVTIKLYLTRVQEGDAKVAVSLSIAKDIWRKGDYLARCIRNWGREFLETGELKQHHQGAHSKVTSLADDEGCKEKCLVWLRSQKPENRGPLALKKFIEQEVFPKMTGDSITKTTIHESTCRRFMALWGFKFDQHHKGVYMDGHEREDVKNERKQWSAFMMEKEKLMTRFEEEEKGEWKEVEPILPPGEKKVVQITHDESCFHAHDGKKMMWLEKGEQVLRKKGDGKSIMVSGFLCPCHGPLDMETIEPGANADGYWTNTDMVAQVSATFFFQTVSCDN